jgi:putative nucleotidyltransferase with HDIG domain
VAPIELNPKLSKHLSAAILRSLEKAPALRFAGMRELRDALEGLTGAQPLGVEEESFEKRDAREASFVVTKLTNIILLRLEKDNLLIPAMPAIAVQCMHLLDDPEQSFSDVGKLVGKDPVLASRVLRLANSAAFPGKSPVTTLEPAIVRMGTEGLKLALVNYSMYQAFSSKDARIQSSFRAIWEHSLAVALIARELADRMSVAQRLDPGVAYLAGLLHDVGKPVVGALLLEAERLMANKKSSTPWISHNVWKRVVAGSHRRVGVALARRWNLPSEISQAVEGSVAFDPAASVSFANLVCLANAVAKQQGLYAGDVDVAQMDDLVAQGKVLLGLSDEAIAITQTGLYHRVGTLLELKPPAAKAKVPVA